MGCNLPPGCTQADIDRHADERAGEPDGFDESYERFLEECAAECRCCHECGGFGIPCAGVTSGGICDKVCRCDRDDEPCDYDGFPEDDADA